MSIAVHIPAPLRIYSDGAAELTMSATTVRDALRQLRETNEGLYVSVCNETGAVRQHVHLFVNDDLLRYGDGLDTKLKPGDVLSIMPAVSGG